MGKRNTDRADEPITPQTQKKQQATQKGTHLKKSKYHRFDDVMEPDPNNKTSWPTDAVVYIGHLPHGFYEDQLKTYFSQYGEVMGVKVGRSRKSARSKGYAFLQFKYAEVAAIVADTMNGYLLMEKVLVSHTLKPNDRNPFRYATSKRYKFVDWKRVFMKQVNRQRTSQELANQVKGLLRNEERKKQRLRDQGINYDYPGFAACLQ